MTIRRITTLLHRPALAAALVGGLPSAALACGGLFCNATQPVNQSAERILFAQEDDGKMHMHVRISYAGPPTDFAWLLPTPPDVETELSSEQLFQALDQQVAPIFSIQRQLGETCLDARAAAGFEDDSGNGGGPEPPAAPSVDVLSREAVGPYDRVILRADNVGVLRGWLDENGFAIPEGVDATLTPYIEMGSVFVAIKLLPGADAGDVVPLHLSFTSSTAAIPLVPTRVAADPDMGVIVHLLAGDRAIPKNYAHVQINEAAIDWLSAGSNYGDVVSAAADEAAGGKAWATDYAGPSDVIPPSIAPIDEATVAQIKQARTLGDLLSIYNFQDADLLRLAGGFIEPPDGVPAAQFLACPFCYDVDPSKPVDGEALAAQIEAEVNPPRVELAALFAQHDYLTRLYTTMSPEEMDQDPIFATNPDLGPVDRLRTAVWHVVCDEQGNELSSLSFVDTPSGLRFQFDENGQVPDAIQRQAGATVRGADAPAARIIERMFEQGQPEVISDNTKALRARYSAQGGDGGCGCDVDQGGSPATAGLLFLGLLGLGSVARRRR